MQANCSNHQHKRRNPENSHELIEVSWSPLLQEIYCSLHEIPYLMHFHKEQAQDLYYLYIFTKILQPTII